MIDSCKRGLRRLLTMGQGRINAGGLTQSDRDDLIAACEYIEEKIKFEVARQWPIHNAELLDRLRCAECRELMDEVQRIRCARGIAPGGVLVLICTSCFQNMSAERKEELHVGFPVRAGKATP